MPAYRSEAEAQIRMPVVARLREMIPGCRIIHEINAECFGNRIDVLAVGQDRVAAVEIKSAKDKLDRLPTQIKAMRGVTNEVFAALHEKFLDGVPSIGVAPPNEAHHAVTWVWPRQARRGHIDCGEEWNSSNRWKKPMRNLPATAINILWREELHSVCGNLGVTRVSRLNMDQAIDEIRWRMTGEQITKMVCRVLRRRSCIEADAPVAANDNADSQTNAA